MKLATWGPSGARRVLTCAVARRPRPWWPRITWGHMDSARLRPGPHVTGGRRRRANKLVALLGHFGRMRLWFLHAWGWSASVTLTREDE